MAETEVQMPINPDGVKLMEDDGWNIRCGGYDPATNSQVVIFGRPTRGVVPPASRITFGSSPVVGGRHSVVGLTGIDPWDGVWPHLIGHVGGGGTSSQTPAETNGSSSGGPPGDGPPPPSNKDLVIALLDAVVDADKKSAAALDYLDHLKWRENWRVMPEAVVYDDTTIDLPNKQDVIRSKFGLPTGEYEKFLKEAVASAVEVNRQIKVWRWLAWPALLLLLIGIVAAGVFTYEGFQLVADGKMKGYELVALIFVLALVAISPPVLLLLQRPLKGIDQWSPTAPKSGDDAEKDTKG